MEKPFLRRFTKKILIFANCAFAIFFLAGAYVKYFNPVQWWFLGLFTLILPYLLLLLLIFFVFFILL